MKTLALILISSVLIGCVAPSRLGVRYQGEEIGRFLNNNNNQNQNITLSVHPLTNEDVSYDVDILRNEFESYVYKNADLNRLIKKYPDLKINMEVLPNEEIKRTWILDIAFFYPGLGVLLPYTPWWGNVKLDAKLTITVPNRISDDYKFSTIEPFVINSYPYYRAGKILTIKYSVAYKHLFEQLDTFNLLEFVEKAEKTTPEVPPIQKDKSAAPSTAMPATSPASNAASISSPSTVALDDLTLSVNKAELATPSATANPTQPPNATVRQSDSKMEKTDGKDITSSNQQLANNSSSENGSSAFGHNRVYFGIGTNMIVTSSIGSGIRFYHSSGYAEEGNVSGFGLGIDARWVKLFISHRIAFDISSMFDWSSKNQNQLNITIADYSGKSSWISHSISILYNFFVSADNDAYGYGYIGIGPCWTTFDFEASGSDAEGNTQNAKGSFSYALGILPKIGGEITSRQFSLGAECKFGIPFSNLKPSSVTNVQNGESLPYDSKEGNSIKPFYFLLGVYILASPW